MIASNICYFCLNDNKDLLTFVEENPPSWGMYDSKYIYLYEIFEKAIIIDLKNDSKTGDNIHKEFMTSEKMMEMVCKLKLLGYEFN